MSTLGKALIAGIMIFAPSIALVAVAEAQPSIRIGASGSKIAHRILLRDSSTLATRLKKELRANSKPGQHVNERIAAEEVDSAAHEIADPGLGDAKKLGCLGLLQPACGDHLLQVRHEL